MVFWSINYSVVVMGRGEYWGIDILEFKVEGRRFFYLFLFRFFILF